MTTANVRPLNFDEREAAGYVQGMKGFLGCAVVGPKRTVYVARCDGSRHYYPGWWVKAGEVMELVRTEKQGLKKATEWATKGFPSEQ